MRCKTYPSLGEFRLVIAGWAPNQIPTTRSGISTITHIAALLSTLSTLLSATHIGILIVPFIILILISSSWRWNGGSLGIHQIRL